jgi:dATP/dGTP diphosphohydrolase
MEKITAVKTILPSDAKERKNFPVATGVLDYFPSALVEVARVSKVGNDQHNPGQPLHWARGKSTDQADTIIRHFLERGKFDVDGLRHSAKLAWRALALLQEELEAEGAPLGRGSKLPEESK